MEEQPEPGRSQARASLAQLPRAIGGVLDWRPIDRLLLLIAMLLPYPVLITAAVLVAPYTPVWKYLNPAAFTPALVGTIINTFIMFGFFAIGWKLRRTRDQVLWLETAFVVHFNAVVMTAFYFTGFYASNGTIAMMLGLVAALPMLDLRAISVGVWTYLVVLPGIYLLEQLGVLPRAPIYRDFPRFADPQLEFLVEISRLAGTWLLVFILWLLARQFFSHWHLREAEFRALSKIDMLTGVRNRRSFFELLESEHLRARRLEHPMSLLMCDLDYFKKVNDTWGHGAGDEVLRAVARTIEEGLRTGVDVLGRFGGEEFVVLLPETGAGGALAVAERIRERVAALRFRAGAAEYGITLSVGIATGEGEFDPDALVELADQHLYRAKNAGRNCVRAAQ